MVSVRRHLGAGLVAALGLGAVVALGLAPASAQVGSIERGGSFERPYVPPRKRLATKVVQPRPTRPTRPTPRPTPEPDTVEVTADALRHYEAGRAAYDRNDFAGAVEEFEKAIRLDSKYIDALIDLGDAYFDQAALDEAAESYRRALAIDRGNIDAQYRLGRAAFAMRDYDTAATAFQAAMRANVADAQAVYNLGLTYKALKRYEEAIPVFRKAIDMREGRPFPEARLNLARSLYEVDKLDESEAEARRAIDEIGATNPDSANAWYALATAQGKRGQLQEATASLQKAIEVCTGCTNGIVSPFFLALAQVYESRGERVLAADAYERFLELAPFVPGYRVEEIRGKISKLRSQAI